MTTTSNFSKSNHRWRFAECVDANGKTAKLVIHYLTRGKLAPHPLILELSECQRPKVVMDKLLDRGADIDPDIDDKLLAKMIKRNALQNGIYFSKAGLHGDMFIANGKAYGNTTMARSPSTVGASIGRSTITTKLLTTCRWIPPTQIKRHGS